MMKKRILAGSFRLFTQVFDFRFCLACWKQLMPNLLIVTMHPLLSAGKMHPAMSSCFSHLTPRACYHESTGGGMPGPRWHPAQQTRPGSHQKLHDGNSSCANLVPQSVAGEPALMLPMCSMQSPTTLEVLHLSPALSNSTHVPTCCTHSCHLAQKMIPCCPQV